MRIRNLMLLPAVAMLFTAGACKVEQTREGEAPRINVDPGQAPRYNVETADVNITQDTQQVVTPRVEITQPNN